MAFTLYSLLEAALLFVNAVAILNRERFLAKVGWTTDSVQRGFGEQPGVKAQLVNLIFAVQTVMRDLKALEHSTLKVPYEILNKKFRAAQKTIDREVSHVQHNTNAVEKGISEAKDLDDPKVLQKEPVKVEELQPLVTALLEKFSVLIQKTSVDVADETEAAAVIQRRIRHLKVGADAEVSDTALQEWQSLRVDRLLIEYLLRSGCYQTASTLAESKGLEYMSNLNVFLAAKEVEMSLSTRETGRCLEWCYDNRSKLRRLKSRMTSLELRVREQEFIELIRRGERKQAVDYCRKYFSAVDAEMWSELSGIVVLLAFGPDTQIPMYKELFSERRWEELVKLFREENFRLYHLAHQSVFSACLQSGLSALKTPHCSDSITLTLSALEQEFKAGTTTPVDFHPITSRKRKECPVCLPDVQQLASTLPYAHASQSRLVCAYSGDALNENNPPMMLPNGMVYGRNSLELMASDNNGEIKCPRTGLLTTLDQAVRVFVM